MTYRVTRHHGGDTVSEHDTEEEAIAVAKAEAKRTGQRHNVRSDAGRVVSCYPHAMLWEADIAHLPGAEYVRRHQEAALVGTV